MKDAGFSLIETLVATALLTVTATVLVHLMTLSAAANQLARANTLEALAAVGKLESLKSDPEVAPGGSLTHAVAGYSDLVDGYERRWSVETLSATGGARLLQVVVRNSLPGEVRLVAVSTRWGGAP